MDSRYDFKTLEPTILSLWEKLDISNPDSAINQSKSNRTGKPFSIIMPPPNANDPLHIGHAMFVTIEDILTRFHRMKGDDTLWLPGTDHAGIETQYVFEKKLAKDKQSRFDFDRETLFKMIWDYVQENSDVSVSQIKRLGASADWSRFAFTLDPKIVERVIETFFKLHEDGLVYRDLQLVNYCTKCGTSYSELEVNYIDQVTTLYYIKYPLVDAEGEWISVATVRPEPIFADTHLAVNPNDSSKTHLIGKSVSNPLTGAAMPIIADEYVDPEFGTGIVKLTPAHDANDFAVAKKHNLPIVPAISTRGKILEIGGVYAGLSVLDARKQVVADLESKGLIEKTNTQYKNRVGTCYRCSRVIEPLPLPQFFVKVRDESKNLAAEVENLLDTKQVRVHGAGREKILRNWLAGLKDWNVSRQVVWGIRIPVWYKVSSNEAHITVTFTKDGQNFTGSLEEMLQQHALAEIVKGLQTTSADADVEYVLSTSAPEGDYIPETDTFDTWFSSAQWPVLTLQTGKPDDFTRFYPTSVMETAYDILLFWVMRMLLLGHYLTGKTPFADVYLHGLVRDEKGQKMSKSKGNVINPLTIVDEFGADALRMALVIRSTVGIDKSVGRSDFKAARNLTNKLWNAARLVITRVTEGSAAETPADESPEFTATLHNLVSEVNKQLDQLKIGLAADTIYSSFWHWYCDIYLERLKSENLSNQEALRGLIIYLKLFHPFIPFVTEAIWQQLLDNKLVNEPSLAAADWPDFKLNSL